MGKRCCCAIVFVVSSFVFLLILLGIFFPSNPRLSLAEIRIREFSLTNLSNPASDVADMPRAPYVLSYDLNVTVRAHNPNGLVRVRYSTVVVTLFYRGIQIAEAATDRFHQGHSNVTFPTVSMAGWTEELPTDVGLSLGKQIDQNVVWLSAVITFRYRFQRGAWVSWRCGRHQTCATLTVSPPKAPWGTRLLGHACFSKDDETARQAFTPCDYPDGCTL